MSRTIPFIKTSQIVKTPTPNPASLKTTDPQNQPISQDTKIILIDFFQTHQNLLSELTEKLRIINTIPSMAGTTPTISEYLSSFKRKIEDPKSVITKGNVLQLVTIIDSISKSVGQYAKTFPQIADKLKTSIK